MKSSCEDIYRGETGRARRDFCERYISRKKAVLDRIVREAAEQVRRTGIPLTCRQGCAHCCVLYVEVSLKEAETIVYYLHQEPEKMARFIDRYPGWREQVSRYGDVLESCAAAWKRLREDPENPARQLEAAEALEDYFGLDAECPFLHEKSCSIYEVRPYACATHYVTTPAEWCSPRHPGQPDFYRTEPGGDTLDLSFYGGTLPGPLIGPLPLMVHDILEGGLSYISEITGIAGLVEGPDDAV